MYVLYMIYDGYVNIFSMCVVCTQNCVYVMCIWYLCCVYTKVCSEWYIHGIYVVCVIYEEICVIVCM